MTVELLTGFGSEHETEALPGALPVGRFAPRTPRYGLYTEKFSSTAFTAPRSKNRRTWLYRIRPSVMRGRCHVIDSRLDAEPDARSPVAPEPIRWDPFEIDGTPHDFVDGLVTLAVTGSISQQTGIAVHVYTANVSMTTRAFENLDGELLIVPQSGELSVRTECGVLTVAPGGVAVIPRGMKFRVALAGDSARGYVCENYGAPFELPERGPVGSDGYANTRDFEYPVAAFEDDDTEHELVTRFQGKLFSAPVDHSPFDVVAWVGNSAPYRYDLARFNAMNTVTYDHPDPSIFTVLTSPSAVPGTANADFVIFPPRWAVGEGTFRPPWYHRNVMSEFMGLIHGQYEARAAGEGGFQPGGASLHNALVPHGPDAAAHSSGQQASDEPVRVDGALAFMFESRTVLAPTSFGASCRERQPDYPDAWADLPKQFDGG